MSILQSCHFQIEDLQDVKKTLEDKYQCHSVEVTGRSNNGVKELEIVLVGCEKNKHEVSANDILSFITDSTNFSQITNLIKVVHTYNGNTEIETAYGALIPEDENN